MGGAVQYASDHGVHGRISLPHVLLSLRDADQGLALLRHMLSAGRLPPDWRDEQGVTLLMYAAEQNNAAAVQLLPESGADSSLRRQSAEVAVSAADVARNAGSNEVLTILNAWSARHAIDGVLSCYGHKP